MQLYEYELCEGSCASCKGSFTLRRPITVPLPSGEVSVVAVHFHADDAKGLVRSAQRHLVEIEQR